MEAEKRGLSDYNGEMRRGGRGGGGYRMSSSKDMGPVEMGPYGDKVSFIFILFFYNGVKSGEKMPCICHTSSLPGNSP